MGNDYEKRLEKQMGFLLEMDKLKEIERQNYLASGRRKENDAEHSWHLAMMCLTLHEYANQDVDVLKVLTMVLIHDLIEIDAGDTYAYDEKANQTKREREKKAADRIFNLLPTDQAQYLRGVWDEFEEGVTGEAKFAATLDKMQPCLLNDASNGKSWKEHGVAYSWIMKRNENTADGSKALWDFMWNRYIQANVEKGNLIKDD